MSIDDVSTQLRNQLQEAFGMDGATYLMDRPPGGWNDLVTNDSLDRQFNAFRREMAAEFAVVRSEISAMRFELRAEMNQGFRDQTWRLMAAMLSSMAVLVAVMVAAIRL